MDCNGISRKSSNQSKVTLVLLQIAMKRLIDSNQFQSSTINSCGTSTYSWCIMI